MEVYSEIQTKFHEKMEKSVSILKENLNTVRAGRANPALLDKVSVEYYGMPTPLKSIANISVPDPRSLLIAPFDPKSIHDIEKAIGAANIGINPANDGKVIRLQIPSLTEERRRELTKVVKKYGEEAKVAIRNERRDANEHLKKLEKGGDLTEDDLKSEEKEVQKKTDETIKRIDEIVADKEKEILEV
jgi:ribosome recycling factor